jgi:hypothetical protein
MTDIKDLDKAIEATKKLNGFDYNFNPQAFAFHGALFMQEHHEVVFKALEVYKAVKEDTDNGMVMAKLEGCEVSNNALAKSFHPQMEGQSVDYLWKPIRAAVAAAPKSKLSELMENDRQNSHEDA